MSNYKPKTPNDVEPLSDEMREIYGAMVRAAWVAWAEEQPNPKPSWLVPWSDLDESMKEVDRRIGDTFHGYFERLLEKRDATIRAREAELADYRATISWHTCCPMDARRLSQLRQEEERAEKAESERDALADQLAAVVDAAIYKPVPDVSFTRCLICDYTRYGPERHHESCPLTNLPATVQARREQFEEVNKIIDEHANECAKFKEILGER